MFPKIVRTEAIAATSSSAISLIEIGGILGTLWCGWFSDAYMVSRSMICSVCSIAAGLCVSALSSTEKEGLFEIACFLLGFVLTTAYRSIHPVMFVVFALVGLAWAAINVNSLPMVVEMCKGSDIGKFTGYYYTASMAAQVITPILAGTLMRAIDYRVLFPYAALFAALSFVTMCFVRHGDVKVQAKKGLSAFEDMED